MFVAMNHFRVSPGREDDFEAGWRSRESLLARVPGFRQFALLRGDEAGEYISHTTWASRADFVAWAGSEAFRQAHSQRMPEGVLAEHPRARFYEAVLVEHPPAAAP